MITAVIETRNDEVALAHLLAALVRGATEGVVREVIVVDYGSEDGTLTVADAAGCTVVEDRARSGDPRRAAIERARGDWLLFLAPGATLAPDWIDAVLAFINGATAAGTADTAVARFRRGKLVSSWRARLTELWSWLTADRDPGAGVLISKRRWLDVSASSPASAASFASGARRGAA